MAAAAVRESDLKFIVLLLKRATVPLAHADGLLGWNSGEV